MGAESVVALKVLCFVLDSNKPLWKGELTDCGLVLGTNSLDDLGFKITQHDGITVESDNIDKEEETVLPEESPTGVNVDVAGAHSTHPSKTEVEEVSREQKDHSEIEHQVTLSKSLRLGSQQTQLAKVHVSDGLLSQVFQVGRVCPSSELEGQQCDLLEGLWEDDKEFNVSVTNWGMRPVTISKDTVIGKLEVVELVAVGNSVWEKQSPLVAVVSDSSIPSQQKRQLEEQLCIGECNVEDRATLQKVILLNHDIFALSNEELGETNLVEH